MVIDMNKEFEDIVIEINKIQDKRRKLNIREAFLQDMMTQLS
jgi:Ni,Fe-hydrogenase III component G